MPAFLRSMRLLAFLVDQVQQLCCPLFQSRSRESEQQEVAVGANTQLFPYVHRSIDGADSPHDRPWV